MKRYKILALMLALCLMAGSVASCSGGKDPADISVTTAEATVDLTEDTSASSESTEATESSDTETSESETSKETSESSEDTKATDPEESKDTEPSEDSEPTNVEPDKITFEGESQTYANTFMTNFVEQWFYYDREDKFDVKTAKVEDVLRFAAMHLNINSPKEFKGETKGECSYETISVDKACDVIGKYMMYALNEDDCKTLPAPAENYADKEPSYWGPYYEDGKVWFEMGAGEAYTNIAVVDYGKSNEDGNMTLVFTIYAIDFDVLNDLTLDELKEYYKISPEKAASDKTLTKKGVGVAEVSVGQSGKYFLNTYKVELIKGD